MSTKRDRLKKMRDEHKNLMNEETPAEEYIEAAASYSSETAEEKEKENITASASMEEHSPASGTQSETKAQPQAEAKPQPHPEAKPQLQSEIPTGVEPNPAETPVASKQVAPVMATQPVAAQAPIMPAAPQQEISAQNVRPAAPLSYQTAEPVKEELRPSRSIPYTVANEPGKRISVSLRTENKNWMHRTALRCGLSIQDYMNILIEEAWQREQSSPYLWNEDDPIPERIPSSKTILVAIKLTNVNIERSQRMRAARCMTMTYYMNYLIEEEAKREQLQGMRRAIFD